MQEFANRKKRADDKKGNNDAESAKYSKCRAAESTGNKVRRVHTTNPCMCSVQHSFGIITKPLKYDIMYKKLYQDCLPFCI